MLRIHTKSREALEIFDEVVTFLRAKVPWIAQEVGKNTLENLDVIRANNEDFRTAWELFNKFDELSFTDCTTLSLSKRLKIRRVVTFDQSLMRAFEKVKRNSGVREKAL